MRGTASSRERAMDSPQPRFVVKVTSADREQDEDLDEPLYTPFRSWLEAKPGRPVLAAALALIFLQAVFRG
jgi:hypothetical protein